MQLLAITILTAYVLICVFISSVSAMDQTLEQQAQTQSQSGGQSVAEAAKMLTDISRATLSREERDRQASEEYQEKQLLEKEERRREKERQHGAKRRKKEKEQKQQLHLLPPEEARQLREKIEKLQEQ